MRMHLLGFVAACMTAIGGGAALAGPVVVELYTSQGCSSCPPADKILGQIADRDDVIALALHVDYWDYIGWVDSFASPEFTKRQRSYARAAGTRTIYTPQMVIGGKDHVVGSKAMKVSETIMKHAQAPDVVGVKLRRDGDKLQIDASALGRVPSGMVVQLVTFTPKAKVKIRRGENAGRTLTYHNIVQDWIIVGSWNGRSGYNRTVKVPKGASVAVLIQEKNAGRILGAAKLN